MVSLILTFPSTSCAHLKLMMETRLMRGWMHDFACQRDRCEGLQLYFYFIGMRSVFISERVVLILTDSAENKGINITSMQHPMPGMPVFLRCSLR